MSRRPASGLLPRRDPLRLLLSPSPWAGAAYLASYVVVGTVLFAVAVVAVVVSGVLSIFWLGLPLLVGAALVVRGCAEVERVRLRLVAPGPVAGRYLEVTQPGLLAQLSTRWRDPATRRGLAYVVGLWAPLLALDLVALVLWLYCLAGISIPLWYWSVPQTFDNGQTLHGLAFGSFPNGPDGPGGWGIWVGDLGTALAVAAAFLVLFLLVNYLVVIVARVHARIARALLGPWTDPLAAANQVLASPGPLSQP